MYHKNNLLPSYRFYNGLLESHPRSHDRPRPSGFVWPNQGLPVAFVAVENSLSSSGAMDKFASLGTLTYMNTWFTQ